MSDEVKEIVGRKYYSINTCTKDEDGFWKIESKLGESVSFDGEEWADIVLDAMAIDKDMDNAYRIAVGAVLAEFQQKTLDKGFNSLFEAEAYRIRKEQASEAVGEDSETS